MVAEDDDKSSRQDATESPLSIGTSIEPCTVIKMRLVRQGFGTRAAAGDVAKAQSTEW